VEWEREASCLRCEAPYHINQKIRSKDSWFFQHTLFLGSDLNRTDSFNCWEGVFLPCLNLTLLFPCFPGTNNKRRLGQPLRLDDLCPAHSTYHQQLPHAMGRQKTGRAIEFKSPLYDEGQSITYMQQSRGSNAAKASLEKRSIIHFSTKVLITKKTHSLVVE
jgi:hypothetical protein